MTKKDLVLVAKALNEVLELDEEDVIDTSMNPKELEKELKQCIGGNDPELEIMLEDDFDDKIWALLAELGNETAKKKIAKPVATKTRKKVVVPEVVEEDEDEVGTDDEGEDDDEEEEKDAVGTDEEEEEEAPKAEVKKSVKEKKGRHENDVKPEKKSKPSSPKKRVVTVIEAIESLCVKGATTAEIYQKADEIYANSGGKAGSIATNVTKNSIQVLQHFGILTDNNGELHLK